MLREAGVPDALVNGLDPASWGQALSDHMVWNGPTTMTAVDVAVASGIDEHEVRRIWSRLGFPDPEDRVVFRSVDVDLFKVVVDGAGFFGDGPIEHFTRAIGAAARRISEAAFALLREERGLPQTESPLADQLRLATTINDLSIRLSGMVATLVLRNLAVAADFNLPAYEHDRRSLHLAVGFCDLVGSTELTNEVPSPVMAAALAAFEAAAADAVLARGGRIVKFVGDEVMFAVADPAVAIAVASTIIGWVDTNPTLGSARAGVVHGPVIPRDGDLYGATVNLAARLAAAAPAGCVVIEDPRGNETVTVRGFAGPVSVRTIDARSSS